MKNIIIDKLTVEYDIQDDDGNVIAKKKALDDINLEIEEGEYIAIFGRNGSGKSTFAKTLNALITPTDGNVIVYGMNTRDEKNVFDIRKFVGMAFQNPDNQIVASVVEEDVAFGLENIGVESSEIRQRIDVVMKNLGIYDMRKSVISKLSGGQKQKVAIAGVLALCPKVLVLDEPTSMLDKKARNETMAMLKKLNKEDNITTILITHYIEEIYDSDRVVVMDGGKIVMEGNFRDILLESDKLEKSGVELPYIPKLANELKKRGLNYKGNEVTVDELNRG